MNTISQNQEVSKEILKYKDVPLIYGPTKSMLKKPSEPGLLNFIYNATSKQEVLNLLKKGELDYKTASNRTRKKWKNLAEKKLSELNK